MPFPRQHLLISPIGDCYNAVEEWTFTLRVDRVALPTTAEMDALVAAYTTYMSAANSAISTYHRLLGLKVAPIGQDGLYPPASAAVERILAAPVAGSSLGNAMIPQQTQAVSLQTALSRGRGSRGRFYPPPQNVSVGTDGRTALAMAQSRADAAKTLINSIQTALAAPVVVGSELAVTLRAVTQVEVGRVVDTQRRRRGALAEEWQTAAVTPLPGA
jgi:hypothetical protein